MASALEYGSLTSDRRIQVKMPSAIVDELDREFPNIDRSKLLTQAALDLLMRKKRLENPQLEHWQQEEQYDLDRMWNYLDQRENE